MAEYIVKTDKPIRLDEVLHLHGIHHYAVQKLPPHGALKDTDFIISCLDEIKDTYPRTYEIVKGILDRTPTVLAASK